MFYSFYSLRVCWSVHSVTDALVSFDRRLEVESRLALVKAQEEEVRAIVDAHLEREAALKRLLEELYREQQQAGGLMVSHVGGCEL